ncbi:hypothetical protein SAMN05660359_02988 [Geodermatophilus obscurus]|uniref:Integral membrane protein n=1 Tax=Geodermatophilus obscurus TaxID=1861 RepID=A0A1I5GPD7_9ACTN|nr:hypothetical protein [Geodermatophilus obscurus]SFO37780.1 hypothetical protein SAMN05660359_02988 [Geodermatophilus obscurus]
MADGRTPVPRPVPVRVAAGLGLLVAAYTLVSAVPLFAGVSIGVGYALFGAVFLGVSVLAAVGSVRALSGRGGGLLSAAGAVFAGLAALGLVLGVVSGRDAGVLPLVLIAVGVAVVVLLTRPESRAFFAATRGGR